MTLGEALTLFRAEKPCGFGDEVLIRYISQVERIACDEIFLTHEGAPSAAVDFQGYDEQTPLDTELLIGSPFDGIYGEYLTMKADLTYYDVERYNNSANVFYNDYISFASAYNREHTPAAKAQRFLTE